ncbi:MAG: hypothetical protein Q7V63_04585 [Gammaproteobacteria bacterium]|nr:hypothetical protein [Gammaproteobacteria bacterium]
MLFTFGFTESQQRELEEAITAVSKVSVDAINTAVTAKQAKIGRDLNTEEHNIIRYVTSIELAIKASRAYLHSIVKERKFTPSSRCEHTVLLGAIESKGLNKADIGDEDLTHFLDADEIAICQKFKHCANIIENFLRKTCNYIAEMQNANILYNTVNESASVSWPIFLDQVLIGEVKLRSTGEIHKNAGEKLLESADALLAATKPQTVFAGTLSTPPESIAASLAPTVVAAREPTWSNYWSGIVSPTRAATCAIQ